MSTKTDTNKFLDKPVFVYGTLKKGFRLHSALNGAMFVGEASVPGIIITLGAFPALVKRALEQTDPQVRVYGELYKITGAILKRLDAVEGEGFLYKRVLIQTSGGLAWAYELMKLPDNWGNLIVESGRWGGVPSEYKDIAV